MKVICVRDYENQQAIGHDVAHAYKEFCDQVDDEVDIDDLKFYELGREIKVELRIVEINTVSEKLPK